MIIILLQLEMHRSRTMSISLFSKVNRSMIWQHWERRSQSLLLDLRWETSAGRSCSISRNIRRRLSVPVSRYILFLAIMTMNVMLWEISTAQQSIEAKWDLRTMLSLWERMLFWFSITLFIQPRGSMWKAMPNMCLIG